MWTFPDFTGYEVIDGVDFTIELRLVIAMREKGHDYTFMSSLVRNIVNGLEDFFRTLFNSLGLDITQVILAWLLSWIMLWFGITHDTVFMGHWLPYPDPVVKFSALVLRCLNTLRPRQNGRLFADDTFKRIFLNENIKILIKISLKFVPRGLINNIPALVQIMAWRRPCDKPLSEPMMV